MYTQLFVCLKLPVVFIVSGDDIGLSRQDKQCANTLVSRFTSIWRLSWWPTSSVFSLCDLHLPCLSCILLNELYKLKWEVTWNWVKICFGLSPLAGKPVYLNGVILSSPPLLFCSSPKLTRVLSLEIWFSWDIYLFCLAREFLGITHDVLSFLILASGWLVCWFFLTDKIQEVKDFIGTGVGIF